MDVDLVYSEHGRLKRLVASDLRAATSIERAAHAAAARAPAAPPAAREPLPVAPHTVHATPSSLVLQVAAVLFCIISLVTFGELVQIQYDNNAGSPGSQASDAAPAAACRQNALIRLATAAA